MNCEEADTNAPATAGGSQASTEGHWAGSSLRNSGLSPHCNPLTSKHTSVRCAHLYHRAHILTENQELRTREITVLMLKSSICFVLFCFPPQAEGSVDLLLFLQAWPGFSGLALDLMKCKAPVSVRDLLPTWPLSSLPPGFPVLPYLSDSGHVHYLWPGSCLRTLQVPLWNKHYIYFFQDNKDIEIGYE